jgi:hypothetical protein
MKLKLTLVASAAYFALTLAAYAVSVSSDTNGVPGDVFSTAGSQSKANPIPPERRSSEIIVEQGSAAVMTLDIPPPRPAPLPVPQ